MKTVVDSIKGNYYKCLLENGDIITLHKSCFPENIQIGNILKLSFELDKKASEQQNQLMNNE